MRHFILFFVLLFLCKVGYSNSPTIDTVINQLNRAEKMQENGTGKALKLMQNALELAIKEKERYGELKANLSIGLYYFKNNQFDEAINAYQKSVGLAQDLDSLYLEGWALARLGNSYFRLKRFEAAKLKMETALSIFKKVDTKKDIAQTLANLGNIYIMLGQNDDALDTYLNAYDLFDKIGAEDDKLGIELNISYYYLMNGSGEAALPYINRSLEYNLKKGRPKEIAMSYGNLGYAYSLIGNYADAFKSYQHCVDTAQKYQFTQVECDTYKDIAETYKKSGNWQQAMEFQTKYYTLRDSIIGKETQDKVSELQVEFETAEQLQQIEKLQQQEKIRNLQIGLLAIGLILLGTIAWFVIQKQRSNLIEKQEVIAKNEEIYSLEKELIEKELQQKQLEQERIRAEANILKLQEAEARKYAEVLENSNKELETFAHVVAHDLREPLRMISSYIHLIKRRLDKESLSKTAEFFDFALDGSERMNKLIDGILNLAKVQQQELRLRPIQLNDIALVATQNLREAIEEKQAVVNYTDLPQINGDKLQIVQLFQNIISNGIKYNTNETPTITINHKVIGDKIEIAFKDNGIGIEEKYQSNIFKMFNRLESHRFSGTGIGLATCQKIAERHGGTIMVESKVDEGTTFIVTLPLK